MKLRLFFAPLAALLATATSPAIAQEDPNPPERPSFTPMDAAAVSASGSFRTSYPIEVPQARGPAPKIALVYDSGSGNGLAGVGWRIDGFPAVIRERYEAGINFNSNDQFAYVEAGWPAPSSPNDRLVASGSNFYQAKVVGGTLPQQFRASAAVCGSGPCYWEMRNGSGTVYYFGGDAAAHAGLFPIGSWSNALWERAPNPRGLVAYPLYKVVDPDGNYLIVKYHPTLRPSTIEYNLPEVGPAGRSMSVYFQYATRLDVTPAPGLFDVRLAQISVYGDRQIALQNGSLIRQYRFTYTTSLNPADPDYSAHSSSSLLTEVREYGSDAASVNAIGLEPTTFQYSEGPDGTVDASLIHTDTIAACDPTADPMGCRWTSMPGDLDGDGATDLVRAYFGSTADEVLVYCGSSASTLTQREDSPANISSPGGASAMADFNGDGLQDVIRVEASAGTIQAYIAQGQNDLQAPGCKLGTFVAQPALTFSGVTMAPIASWQILPADINGDGAADLVAIDVTNRTIYYSLAASGVLSTAWKGRFRANAEWSFCSFPGSVNFDGIQALDDDGDGDADIVASWSRGTDSFGALQGQIAVLTSRGGAAGLSTPTMSCEAVTRLGAPQLRFPYLTPRSGDFNGDGRDDVVFTYQGNRTSDGVGTNGDGVANSRDIRVRLGAHTPGPPVLYTYNGTADFPYPIYGTNLNPWSYAVGDINGDRLDDYIQSYRGLGGNRLYFALGGLTTTSPAGLVSSGPNALTATIESAVPAPDCGAQTCAAGTPYSYPPNLLALGDLNGDGRKDVVRLGDASGAVHFGIRSGLNTVAMSFLGAAPRGGDSRAIRLFPADFNGDGRDDIMAVNENAQLPSYNPNTGGEHGVIDLWIAPAPLAGHSGIPDLLTRIDNGRGGVTTIDYEMSTRIVGAVRDDYPSTCMGPNGYLASPSCGAIDRRPRVLTRRVVRDNGVTRNGTTFKTSTRYDYVNGRTVVGAPSQRRSLGFSEVRATNEQDLSYKVDYYRQDQPYEGLLRQSDHYSPSTLLTRDTNTYLTCHPGAGREAICISTQKHCPFQGTTSLPCVQTTYGSHDLLTLLPSFTSYGSPTLSGDRPVWSYTTYRSDVPNWRFLPQARWSKRQNASLVWILLDMWRYTYDLSAGNETHLLQSERMLFTDAEGASCSLIDDPVVTSGVCSEKLATGAGRWVSVFLSESPDYDPQGNITAYESLPVVRDGQQVTHLEAMTYDTRYSGLVESRTDALGQSQALTYDSAGRVVGAVGKNGEAYGFIYDVYGRPTARTAPGTNATYVWQRFYDGFQSGLGYKMRELTASSAALSHTREYFIDGFGMPAEHRDLSPLTQGELRTRYEHTWSGGRRLRRSRPYLAASPGPDRYEEVLLDPRGRPTRVARLTSTFATDMNAAGGLEEVTFSHAPSSDAKSLVTTRSGLATGTSKTVTDYRGLLTSRIDALNQVTQYTYGTGFSVSQVTLPSGGGLVAGPSYVYDSWGRLVVENDPNGEGVVRYTYDDSGALIGTAWFSSSAMTTKTREVRYKYDALDRLVEEGSVNTVGSYLPVVTLAYDSASTTNGIGRLTSAVDPSGTTSFGYDTRGNLSALSIAIVGLPGTTNYTLTYNDQDRLLSRTSPGSTHVYNYSSDGKVLTVSNNGAVVEAFEDFDQFKVPRRRKVYDVFGTFANTEEVTFNNERRVQTQKVRNSSGTLIQDLSFAYDGVGNVIRITDLRPSKVVNGVDTSHTRAYAYDALNRLCASWVSSVPAGTPSCGTTNPAPFQTHTYDGIGNPLTDGASTISYSSSGPNRTITKSSGSTVLWRAYHDTEGRRTRTEDCSGGSGCTNTNYEYDYAGRLSRVLDLVVQKESFLYDFSGVRRKRTLNVGATAVSTWYAGPDLQVVESSAAPGVRSKKSDISDGAAQYVTAPLVPGQASASAVDSGVNQPLAGSTAYGSPEGLYSIFRDYLGTPILFTKPVFGGGDQVARRNYGPWGELLSNRSIGLEMSDEKYNGHLSESFSSLMYYRSRYYDPKTRLFLTADDRLDGGGAQGYNRHSYVRNNPSSFRDPTGRQACGPASTQAKTDGAGCPKGDPNGVAGGAADGFLDMIFGEIAALFGAGDATGDQTGAVPTPTVPHGVGKGSGLPTGGVEPPRLGPPPVEPSYRPVATPRAPVTAPGARPAPPQIVPPSGGPVSPFLLPSPLTVGIMLVLGIVLWPSDIAVEEPLTEEAYKLSEDDSKDARREWHDGLTRKGDKDARKRNEKSGQPASDDVPSWVKDNGLAPRVGQTGNDWAREVMDAKYGPGNWTRAGGKNSPYDAIRKYGDRGFSK